MIELALIVGILGALVGFVVWASNRSVKAGRNDVVVDSQAEAIRNVQTRNEVERNTPVAGAADRLRDSRWNRDRLLPGGETDHDQRRRHDD